MRGKGTYNHNEFKDDYLRNLPPMTETNPNLHGHLTIQIGELAWLKTAFPPENTKMRVKFWGQEGAGRIAVAKNAAPEMHNFYTNSLQYDIRCPALLFQKYLRDMVRLRVEVLDKRNDKIVGNILVNMLLFLKENPKAGNTPIEDIKGLFPIYRNQTSCVKPEAQEKIGEIEIDMNVRFLKFPILQIVPNSNRSHLTNDPTKQHLDSSFLINEMKSQQGNYDSSQLNNNNNLAPLASTPRSRSRSKMIEVQNLLHQQQQHQQNQFNSNDPNNQFDENGEPRTGSTRQLKRVEIQIEEEKEGTNERLQRILQEKQTDQYMRLMKKQTEKEQLEASSYWKERPLLIPELELMRLRMDEAELVSGLSAGVYSDLVSVPDNLPEKENLDLKNVAGYAVQVDTFVLTNTVFKKKLAKAQMHLTMQIPVLESVNGNETKVYYDQLNVACRRAQGLVESNRYEFNQSFPCKLSLDESNISQFTEARVVFTLYISGNNNNNNSGEDGQSRVEFAKGEFRFDQLLLRPFLRGTFDIPLFPTGAFNQASSQSAPNSDTGRSHSVGKGKKKQSAPAVQAGELGISVALLNLMTEFLPYMAPVRNGEQQQQGKNGINASNPGSKTTRKGVITNGINQVIDSRITSDIPFQILLEVKHISNLLRAAQNLSSMHFETLLVRHKVYGKADNLQGMSRGYDDSKKQFMLDYKAVMPADESALNKMKSSPFMLEVWQRKSGVESFVGFVRINLKSLPELILNVHAFASNLTPTILIDGEIAVWDPATNSNVALAHITFAFGTVQQINRYEAQKENRAYSVVDAAVAAATAATIGAIGDGGNTAIAQNGTTQGKNKNTSGLAGTADGQFQQTFQPKNSKNIVTFVKGETQNVKNQQRMFIRNQQGNGLQENVSEVESEPNQSDRSSLGPSIVVPKFKKIRFDEMEYSKEIITKVFVIVMENIRRNKRRAQNILRNFIVKAERNERRVTLREFYNFLNDIPVQEALHIKNGYLHKLISVLDFEASGEIMTPDFIRSYNSFLNYEDILRDNYSHAVKEFALLLASKSYSVTDFERILLRWSDFGFIRREVFKRILEQDLQCEDAVLVKKLLDLLDVQEDGLIQASLLPDYLRGTEVYDKLNYINADSSKYAELVKENLQENLAKNEEGVQELIFNEELADKIMHVRDIQYLIEGLGLEISFWESLCIIDAIRRQLNVPVVEPTDEFTLPFVYFADWLAYVMKQKRDDPQQFNYFTYLVEQRSRIQEEHFIAENAKQVSQQEQQQQQQQMNNPSQQTAADKRRAARQIYEQDDDDDDDDEENNQSGAAGDSQEDNDDDLIMLVNNNYRKP